MHSNYWQVFAHFIKTVSKQNHKVNRGDCIRPFNYQVHIFWNRKMFHTNTQTWGITIIKKF